jgi:hypothetical protein
VSSAVFSFLSWSVGCDFHTRFQQIAMLDPSTGELIERRLEHGNGEAEKFYGALPHGNQGFARLAATTMGCHCVLQSCNAGVSKGCGGGHKASVLLGQKSEALADAVRLARNSVETHR